MSLNFVVPKGFNKTQSFTLTDSTGTAINLSSKTVTFNAKRSMQSTDFVFQKAMSTIVAADGTCKVDFTQSETIDLEIRHYFFYITVDDSGANISTPIRGIVAITQEWDNWVFDIDQLDGETRSTIRTNLQTELLYTNRWPTESLNYWINESIEQFSKESNSIRNYAECRTNYNKMSYILPQSCAEVYRVWFDEGDDMVELEKGRDWIQDGNSLLLLQGSKVNFTTALESGILITIRASRFAQPLNEDLDVLEFPKSSKTAPIFWGKFKALLQDGEESRARSQLGIFNAIVRDASDDAAKRDEHLLQLRAVDSFNVGSGSPSFFPA